MKKLLITGFEPFGGAEENSSWLAVQALPDRVGEYELCRLKLPTVFGTAAQMVLAKAAEFCPDVIISVGVAVGRDAVTPERIAVNIRDARIPITLAISPGANLWPPTAPPPILPPSRWRPWLRPSGKPGFRQPSPTPPGLMSATM